MNNERDLGAMSVLVKSGAVVAALEQHDEVSARALAHELDEPVSSTYRLLGSLTEIGWVEPGMRRGTFRLGVELARIGSLVEDRLNVRDASRPAMRELQAATGATVLLCFLRQDAAVCVECLDGRDVQSMGMRLGDSLPLPRGAAALTLLSFTPEIPREAILARLDGRRAAGEDVPPGDALRAEIERTRQTGYAVSDEHVTSGIAAIGAPVFNHRGELEASISVSGLRDQVIVDGSGVHRLVVSAAEEASRALGYTGDATT